MYACKIHIYDTEKIVQVQLVLRVEKPKGLKYSVLGERLLKSGENHVCRLINPSIGDPLAGSEILSIFSKHVVPVAGPGTACNAPLLSPDYTRSQLPAFWCVRGLYFDFVVALEDVR